MTFTYPFTKKDTLETRCYQKLKLFSKTQKLYKPTEFGAEFHWNEKLDDCSPVNLLNIDWSARQSKAMNIINSMASFLRRQV